MKCIFIYLVELDDAEYRYWSFMEAHPAHNSLPANAKMEAMDVLTWAWTGNNGYVYSLVSLRSSFHFFFHRASLSLPSWCSCPFQSGRMPRIDGAYSILWRYLPDISFSIINILIDEQMIMMSTEPKHALFLRFSSKLVSLNFYLYCLSHFDFWLTAINILAHWRQSCFRPKELLLTNVGSNHSSLPIEPRQLFKWVIIDFFISCLFLCIPYISIERTTCLSTRTVDEESGFPNATPTLVIGAYTCLVVRPYTPSLSKPTFLCGRKATVVLSTFCD